VSTERGESSKGAKPAATTKARRVRTLVSGAQYVPATVKVKKEKLKPAKKGSVSKKLEFTPELSEGDEKPAKQQKKRKSVATPSSESDDESTAWLMKELDYQKQIADLRKDMQSLQYDKGIALGKLEIFDRMLKTKEEQIDMLKKQALTLKSTR